MLKNLSSLATVALMGLPAWVVVLGLLGFGSDPGAVVVLADDAGAEVWVGDQNVSSHTSTFGPVDVFPGEHRVRVKVGGFPVYDRQIVVEPGSRTIVRATSRLPFRGAAASEPVADLEISPRPLAARGALPTAVGSAANGRYFLASGTDGVLSVFDASTGETRHAIRAHEGRVLGFATLSDGHSAVTAGDDQVIRIWDLDHGTMVREIRVGRDNIPVCMTATRDGRRVAVGHFGGVVQVFDLATGRELRRRSVAPCSPGSLAFSADGETLMLGLAGVPGSAHPVAVWDLATGEDRASLRGHDAPVWAIALLPDGRALTGGSDHTLRLWDLATGQELKRFSNHPGVIFSIAVSPDGRHALTGTGHQWNEGWVAADAYGAQVWDLEAERPLGRLVTSSPVRCVSFSDDGRHAVAGSDDRQLRSWALPTLPGATATSVARGADHDAEPAG